MSNMFQKLKYFPATCTFCRQNGMVFGAYTDKNDEIAVCPECSHKLILGIDAALKEMERREKEKESTEPKKEGNVEEVEIPTSTLDK
jgi:DNA-directed RNA polymerase subunit RPC12/RpoP